MARDETVKELQSLAGDSMGECGERRKHGGGVEETDVLAERLL